ncbi:MAG: histidine--tRNA ligase [Candidatus Ancillula sp.]|jgi:histidyl-tRNA synthetase|nr:histidine--tRNA ligase [Candidatus Ancillula sp.]
MADSNIKTSISGFPELLPEGRRLEKAMLEKIRNAFTLYGFDEIEMRAVEPVSQLLAKGETSKEIYLLTRLQDPKIDLKSKKQLGLHFDLTVPFARYVSDNQGFLQFPFRRCSIGKVWRGERPTAGRFREFTQADVDIVARCENGLSAKEALPVWQDLEVVRTINSALVALRELGLPKAIIHVNNRELLQSAYEIFGVQDYEETLRVVDKLDKIGAEEVVSQLVKNGESEETAKKCLQISEINTTSADELTAKLQNLFASDFEKLRGLDELLQFLNLGLDTIVADLKIARGLDYYTGSVFETFLEGFENYGSISSGGRYDNLVGKSAGSKIQYPGVGMSIGVTRLLSILLELNKQNGNQDASGEFSPVQIMVIVNSEEERKDSEQVTEKIRKLGTPAITSPISTKFGKQIDFAFKRKIQNVVFIQEDKSLAIKNVFTGEQTEYKIN